MIKFRVWFGSSGCSGVRMEFVGFWKVFIIFEVGVSVILSFG